MDYGIYGVRWILHGLINMAAARLQQQQKGWACSQLTHFSDYLTHNSDDISKYMD